MLEGKGRQLSRRWPKAYLTGIDNYLGYDILLPVPLLRRDFSLTLLRYSYEGHGRCAVSGDGGFSEDELATLALSLGLSCNFFYKSIAR